MDVNIPIGEFKTHCYQFLDDSNKNNQVFIITCRDKAIAKIVPIIKKISIIGKMLDRVAIANNVTDQDIIEPILSSWNATNE